MDPREAAESAARLRLAFELFAAGESMKREQIRRDHPGASDEEIERMLREWLSDRPGAEHGDAEGAPGSWPRR